MYQLRKDMKKKRRGVWVWKVLMMVSVKLLIQQIQHADKEKCGRKWREIARKRNLKSNAKHSTKYVK